MLLPISFAHWLVIVSLFISLYGSSFYIKDTLAGRTKPNRLSWIMWAVAPLIGTGAALYAEADPWTTVRIFSSGFIPLLVVFFSFFNKQSYWKLGVFDFICGLLSLIAIIAWLLADTPRLAILLAASGDGFAALPTLKKAWTNPETETGFTYGMGLLATILTIPSIPIWNIENSAFQIYLLAVNTMLISFIYRKRLILVFRKTS